MADTPTDDDLDTTIDEIEGHLSVIVSRVRAVWKDSASSIHPDLQPVGYKILGTLARLGETKASTLTEVLGTDKSVISRQIKVLEEIGFVTSRTDPSDGRARVLSVEPAAIEQLRSVQAEQQEKMRTRLRSQSASDVRAFADVLRVLSEP